MLLPANINSLYRRLPVLADRTLWRQVPRWIALITMGLTLALSLQLWLQGGYSLTQSAGIPQWQSEFDMPWIPRFGISIHLAIDGLSLLMVVLTGLLGVLAVLCSWKEIEKYRASSTST